MKTPRIVALGAALAVLLAGCATAPNPTAESRLEGHASTGHTATHSPGASPTSAAPSTPKPAPAPLRAGEQRRRVTMPAAYTPKAPSGGTDDYRCFLLDPRLARDSFVTGYDIAPDQAQEVHHVILYRVPPAKAAAARAKEAATPGDGWTCFSGTGLEDQGASLNDAPWVGAWAPGGRERLLADDLGIPLQRGSLLVMQVHYNLLKGQAADRTSVDLRLSTSSRLKPLETILYVAPVELPCRTGKSGSLCDRERAIWDVAGRFGPNASRTVAGLQLLCTQGFEPRPGPTQSCTRQVHEEATVRAAAGHMHLLGTSIRITLNKGTARAKVLLDVPQWDFDDQGARPVTATRIKPGDTVTVTCTHDQSWRDRLPALKGIPERYVVWGEGTTDEMCLGILSVTRS